MRSINLTLQSTPIIGFSRTFRFRTRQICDILFISPSGSRHNAFNRVFDLCRKLLIVVATTLALQSGIQADTIILREGQKIQCAIVSMTGDAITIKLMGGSTLELSQSRIQSIMIGDLSPDVFPTFLDLKESVKKKIVKSSLELFLTCAKAQPDSDTLRSYLAANILSLDPKYSDLDIWETIETFWPEEFAANSPRKKHTDKILAKNDEATIRERSKYYFELLFDPSSPSSLFAEYVYDYDRLLQSLLVRSINDHKYAKTLELIGNFSVILKGPNEYISARQSVVEWATLDDEQRVLRGLQWAPIENTVQSLFWASFFRSQEATKTTAIGEIARSRRTNLINAVYETILEDHGDSKDFKKLRIDIDKFIDALAAEAHLKPGFDTLANLEALYVSKMLADYQRVADLQLLETRMKEYEILLNSRNKAEPWLTNYHNLFETYQQEQAANSEIARMLQIYAPSPESFISEFDSMEAEIGTTTIWEQDPRVLLLKSRYTKNQNLVLAAETERKRIEEERYREQQRLKAAQEKQRLEEERIALEKQRQEDAAAKIAEENRKARRAQLEEKIILEALLASGRKIADKKIKNQVEAALKDLKSKEVIDEARLAPDAHLIPLYQELGKVYGYSLLDPLVTAIEIQGREIQAEAQVMLDYVSTETGIRIDKQYTFLLHLKHFNFIGISNFDYCEVYVRQAVGVELYGVLSDPESIGLLQKSVDSDDFTDSVDDNFTWLIASCFEAK